MLNLDTDETIDATASIGGTLAGFLLVPSSAATPGAAATLTALAASPAGPFIIGAGIAAAGFGLCYKIYKSVRD